MSAKRFFPTLPGQPFFEGKCAFIQLLYLCLMTIGFAIVISLLGLLVANAIYGADAIENPTAGYYRWIQAFNTIGTFLLPALLFAFCHDRHWFSYNNADHISGNPTAIACVLLMSVALLAPIGLLVELNKMIQLPDCMSGIENWMHETQQSSDRVLELLTSEHTIGTLVLNVIVCALLPAVGEEFFFRGSLQQLFRSWFGNKHLAIWVTSFIFSAIHLQFDGFFARWLLGAYLGYLFVWSGSLWLPVLAHFLHNSISIVAQYIFDVAGIEQETSLNSMTISSALASALVCGVILLFIHKTYHKQNQISD